MTAPFPSILLALLILIALCVPALAQPPAPRPNILFIMSDDHAAHAISSYGSAINTTPNIDRLAREGMRFSNCFCENALCSPSRAAILTGKYSAKNKVIDLSTPLPADQVTFAELLQKSGYATAMVGKWHLHRDPTGFDYWDILPEQGVYNDPVFIRDGKRGKITGYVTDIITDKCIDWLKVRREKGETAPFMLMCHHKAPHRPWQPDAKHANMYDNVDIPLPATFDDDYATRCDPARDQKMSIEKSLTPNDLKKAPPPDLAGPALKKWKYQQYIKDYLRCIASVDDNVGRLLAYLDESGLAANTIVIYTSDQGFFLGDHGWFDKRFMYEEALRMPLLVRFPDHIAAASTCDKFAMNIDFGPTLLDYAGISAPATMQGASLRPLLEGKTPREWRSATFYHYYETGGEHNVAEHIGIRTDRYKLIQFVAPVDCFELYDLEKDPHELHNLAGDADQAGNLMELQHRLAQMKERCESDKPKAIR